MGSHRMGRDRRDFPFADPRKGHVSLCRIQLALELWYRIRYALPRRSIHLRSNGYQSCKSRRQSFLHLGLNMRRVLDLHLLLHP